MGINCLGITARGIICEDEVQVTKLRLKKDGFFCGKNSLISGVVSPCSDKYQGIKYVHENIYKIEFDPKDCVLIDDCLEAIADAANHGVQCILFAPEMEELGATEQEVLNKLNIKVARSWREVKKLVDDKCQKQENDNEQKDGLAPKIKDEPTK